MNDLQVVTDTGLNLPETYTREQFFAVGRALAKIEHGVQWAIGDWYSRIEGDKEKACLDVGLNSNTARTFSVVASAYKADIRISELSFSQHQILLKQGLTQNQRRGLLEKSRENKWTASRLRSERDKLLGVPEKVPLRTFEAKKKAVLDTLPPGASKKLRRATDEMVEKLKHDFQLEVDHVVRHRLSEDRARIRAIEEEAREERDRVRDLRQGLDGLMSEEEYKIVRACLHPDRAPPERRQQFTKAFDIFNRLEKTVNRQMPVKLRRAHGWS